MQELGYGQLILLLYNWSNVELIKRNKQIKDTSLYIWKW